MMYSIFLFLFGLSAINAVSKAVTARCGSRNNPAMLHLRHGPPTARRPTEPSSSDFGRLLILRDIELGQTGYLTPTNSCM